MPVHFGKIWDDYQALLGSPPVYLNLFRISGLA